MAIRVTVHGIDGVSAKLKAMSAETFNRAKAITLNTAHRIAADAKQRAPKDVGFLAASIDVTQEENGLAAVIYSSAAYAPYVEFGTRPHHPPPSALAGWARRHGMPGAEFAIARKIAERGTKPQPFLFPAYEEHRNEYVKAMKEALRELGK